MRKAMAFAEPGRRAAPHGHKAVDAPFGYHLHGFVRHRDRRMHGGASIDAG